MQEKLALVSSTLFCVVGSAGVWEDGWIERERERERFNVLWDLFVNNISAMRI